jgi:aspartate aminotransferase
MQIASRMSLVKPSATLAISAKALELKAQGVAIIGFGGGEPDFDTPENIQNAAMEAMKAGHTRYTAANGIPELKQAVCDSIKRDYGQDFEKENVAITCGGKQALFNLFVAILNPDDEVVIPAPYWVSYPDMVLLAGGKPVIVPCADEDNFKLKPEALDAALNERTRILIMNSPSNPTGAHYSAEELKGLAEVLLKYPEVAIISDDVYYKILFDGATWANLSMVEPALKERTIIANAVSKTYAMTGWRIGWMCGDAAVVKAASKLQGQSTSNPNSIAQYAALEALTGDQSAVGMMVKSFNERRRYTVDRLLAVDGVKCPVPNGAFYVFPNVSAYYGKSFQGREIKGSVDLCAYLMEEANIAVVPGEAFGDDKCIRFSYVTSQANLDEGFDRFAKAMAALS